MAAVIGTFAKHSPVGSATVLLPPAWLKDLLVIRPGIWRELIILNNPGVFHPSMKKPNRKKKIMFLILLFIIILAGVFGGIAWYIKKTQSNLADFILTNPSTAVASYTFDSDGNIIEDGKSIFHNADDQMVMASTMKIIVLATYAEAVASGDLDANEQIPVSDLEKFYLPTTDGGAHPQGLKSIGLDTDELGFARDQSAKITLNNIARIMIHGSGNAETDYLIARLGAERITSLMQKYGLVNHTPIVPILGNTLVMFNHEASFSMESLQLGIDEVSEGNFSTPNRLMELYLNDHQWRASQIAFMTSIFMTSINETTAEKVDMLPYQSEASLLFPKGTAREYAQMMAQIASGRFISTEASTIMQELLEGIPSDEPLRLFFFDRFGAKDGITPSVITIASYAIPNRGELKGESRVVVILANSMPAELWLAQAQSQGHYLLPIDIAQATGQFKRFVESK